VFSTSITKSTAMPGDVATAQSLSSPPMARRRFDSLYSHGFARIAAAVPHLRPAEPEFNTDRTLALARQASDAHAAVVVFPELGISAYAIDDLLHQMALTDAVEDNLGRIVAASADLFSVVVVGAPLRAEGGLFNCGVVIHRGAVLGVVPKSYLPEYREYRRAS
jgi:NAD+ synthase (glutamine-hydrolysing)